MELPSLQPHPNWESGFEERQTNESQLPYFEFVGDLEKSPNDIRQYRLLRLINGMKVVCIHDKDTTRGAASLSVHVGSMVDPPELLGLAHFCEHLLFMGTEKYPRENEYKEYISNNSGSANASTGKSWTKYYFQVSHHALEGALDRFSQFFISPLFRSDYVDRELKAVDSEHKKNIQDDSWRIPNVENLTSNPDHPFHRFSTGGIESLRDSANKLGLDLREEIIKFYNKYYSADIMALSIAGRDSLDKLTEMAVSKFMPVESKGITTPVFYAHPISEPELGKILYIKSLRENYDMKLVFPLSDMRPHYLAASQSHVMSLIHYEGPGSVLSILKKRGWCVDVSTSSFAIDDGFNSLFGIHFTLTNVGFENYKEIVNIMFAYLNLLRSSGPQSQLFEDFKKICCINFQFKEKVYVHNQVQFLSSKLMEAYIKPEHLLSGGVKSHTFDYSLVSYVLDQLRPDNFRLVLTAQKFDSPLPHVDEHYGTKYNIEPFPQEFFDTVLSYYSGISTDEVLSKLSLPQPNMFIPQNIDEFALTKQIPAENPAEEPILLKKNDLLELWFKTDDQFFTPRGIVEFFIETPTTYDSPLDMLLTEMFLFILDDILAEEVYNANCAGLFYSTWSASTGIGVQFSGYTDKMEKLMKMVLSSMRSFIVDPVFFEMEQQKMKQLLDNRKFCSPQSHAYSNWFYLNMVPEWRTKDRLAVFDMITIERLQDHSEHLFENITVKMIVIGPFSEKNALSISQTILDSLRSKPLPTHLQCYHKTLLHNPGKYIQITKLPDEENINNSLLSTIYTGAADDLHERALSFVLFRVMEESFFSVLRTKEQLGYIVDSTTYIINCGNNIQCMNIQSECNPMYLSLRVKEFLRNFRTTLVEMSPETFDNHINSIVANTEEKLKTIFEECNDFFMHICGGYYAFEQKHEMVAQYKSLKRTELVEFWDKYMDPNRKTFMKLESHVWSAKLPYPSTSDLEKYTEPVIALFGCLNQAGATEFSIEQVNEFVQSTLQDAERTSPINDLKDFYARVALDAITDGRSTKSEDEISAVIEGFSTEFTSFVATALSMALEPSEPAASRDASIAMTNAECYVNPPWTGVTPPSLNTLANIGVVSTPNGSCIITDPVAYRSILCQSGVPVPTRKLIPKYKD